MSCVRSLLRQSRSVYPSKPLRHRWVRARLTLGNRKPCVDIGLHAVDTSRAARSLREIGVHPSEVVTVELPLILKRALA